MKVRAGTLACTAALGQQGRESSFRQPPLNASPTFQFSGLGAWNEVRNIPETALQELMSIGLTRKILRRKI